MFKKFGPIFAGVAVAFASGLATPLILLASAFVSTLATTLISPIGAIMLAVVASFKIGDAISQSIGLENVFAKMMIATNAWVKQMKLVGNMLKNPLMKTKDYFIQLGEIKNQMFLEMKQINDSVSEDRNPADIFVDNMVDSFEKGKSKVSTAFENLIPETSFNFEKKLNRFNQNSAIKEGMKNQKIMNFSTLNPFGSTNLAKKDEPKTAKDIINKLQLEQQKKTNNILSRAVNTEGMTFA
jgi:hypothetical protein